MVDESNGRGEYTVQAPRLNLEALAPKYSGIVMVSAGYRSEN